ncbi:MAG: hypothetical protein PHF00_09115 [Elusimicrobia bacterium]|nr:hypothetical protein [Elusimicrobiota bacterium]
MTGLRRELGRKAFHLLILSYWGFYLWAGRRRTLLWFGVWLALVTIGELVRLRFERCSRLVFAVFGGMIREPERREFSSIFYGAAGAWVVVWLAGERPNVAGAAFVCLALGDAAAALAGKAWGRHRVLGGAKSVEGSLACFLVCLAACLAFGAPPAAAAGGALAAAAAELMPTAPLCNDNLWLPVAAAAAMLALGAR